MSHKFFIKHKFNVISLLTFFSVVIFILLAALLTIKLVKNKFTLGETNNYLHSKLICTDCNVIMVSLDTLSANHLPCNGYERNTSPNLCDFASKNIYFTNAYSNASWTLPSHASVFTGLQPNKIGIVNGNSNPPDSAQLFPLFLKSLGYNTMLFLPPDTGTVVIGQSFPLQGFYGLLGDSIYYNDQYDWKNSFDMFRKSVSLGKKTFIFLHTYDVHDPYLIGDTKQIYGPKNTKFPITSEQYFTNFEYSPSFVSQVINDMNKGYPYEWFWQVNKDKILEYMTIINKAGDDYPKQVEILKQMEKEGLLEAYRDEQKYYKLIDKNDSVDIGVLKALYDQKINELDSGKIAELVNFIQDPLIKNNTVLVIFSDHGEEFMEHGHLFHETIYNSNLKVPIIMYVPNVGKIHVDGAVQLADIVPTLKEILGINSSINYDGYSMLSKLAGDNKPDNIIISDLFGLTEKSAIVWPWKLFLAKSDSGKYVPYGLYNLQKDPNEINNVLFSQKNVVKSIISQPSLSEIVSEF